MRRAYWVLRYGRQYQRNLKFKSPFTFPAPGELIAWSKVLDDEEALCVLNGNGSAVRGGDVLVDAPSTPYRPPANPGEPGSHTSP